jgi:hypothetical protein
MFLEIGKELSPAPEERHQTHIAPAELGQLLRSSL